MKTIKEKMRPVFQKLQGGLFADVGKADVGNAFSEMQKSGVSMMSWADPFYPDPSIPPHVKEAAIVAIEGGKSAHYTMPTGDMELKEKIAEKLRKENHMTLDAQRNILITPGSDSGLFYAMMPFISAGDEVLMPDPSYPSNFLNAELLGGVPVSVPLRAEDGFRLNVAEFRKRLTPKTKMVLITNPNNPTTTVFTREDLTQLAAFIVENDLICVCDEAFESIVFDGREFVDIATLPGMWERTLTTFSISKGMGLSGFRVGYIVADDKVIDVLFGATVNVLGATSTVSQQAAIAAFADSAFIAAYNQKHAARRKYAYDAFNAVPGVSMLMPQSSFFCWIDVSALGDSTEIVNYLIREAKVSCNDGKAYGKEGTGHLRLIIGCYLADETAYAAIDRMAKALAAY